MIAHLAKYGPTYVPTIALLLGVTGQASQQYLTSHPTVTVAGFLGTLGLAIVNHWITSPKDSATVEVAKAQSK